MIKVLVNAAAQKYKVRKVEDDGSWIDLKETTSVAEAYDFARRIAAQYSTEVVT